MKQRKNIDKLDKRQKKYLKKEFGISSWKELAPTILKDLIWENDEKSNDLYLKLPWISSVFIPLILIIFPRLNPMLLLIKYFHKKWYNMFLSRNNISKICTFFHIFTISKFH